MVIIYLFFRKKARKEVGMTLLQVPAATPLGFSELDCTPITPKTSKPKNPLIQKCLRKLVKKGLFGRPHVKRYLYTLRRRGCRPNTIRSRFTAIFLFLSHLKNLDRTYLETITRDDLSRFVEGVQDRGLKTSTVYNMLCSFYEFLGYFV
jgi:hypothetical protein